MVQEVPKGPRGGGGGGGGVGQARFLIGFSPKNSSEQLQLFQR